VSPDPRPAAVRCAGFGEDGEAIACDGIPGTPWTPLWCPECDERRRTRLSAQFAQLAAAARERESAGLLPCPNGCGCVTEEDPDARDCACDGPCCFGEAWPIRAAGPAGDPEMTDG
jgi:hypothetical protein